MGTIRRDKYVNFVRSYQSVTPDQGIRPVSRTTQIVKLPKFRTGVDNPMWLSKIKSGQSATSAFSAQKTELKYTTGKVFAQLIAYQGYPGYMKIGWSDSLGSPSIPDILNFPGSLVSSATNKAAIGIRNKIHKEQVAFSGLTMLGELRESIHMIRHPAEAMRAYCNSYFKDMYVKKTRMSRQKFGHVLANSWLEFSFGLIPFMSDIDAIAEAYLPAFIEPRIKRLSFTAQDASSSSSSGTSSAGGLAVEMPSHQDVVNEASCRYLVGYRIKNQGPLTQLQRIKQLGGFNLQEVIPTAWELLPWSFFIDYFSNIGDVISANLVSLEDIAWSQLVTKRSIKIDYRVLGSKAKAFDTSLKVLSGVDFISSSTVTETVRAAASIPFGTVTFELPGKVNQFLNMVALAQTQFVPLKDRKRK